MSGMRVYCGVPSGIQLRLFEMGEVDGGAKQALPKRKVVVLAHGENTFEDADDVDFMHQWFKQNEEHDAVVNKVIYEMGDEGEEEEEEGADLLRAHGVTPRGSRPPERAEGAEGDEDGSDTVSAAREPEQSASAAIRRSNTRSVRREGSSETVSGATGNDTTA